MLGFQVKELRDPHTANEIANRLALYFCYKYETVYAVHEDTDNLNIHIVINSVSYVDGKKYGGTRQEFHAFKAYMGKVLGEYGIDVYYVPNDENQN